MFRVCLPTARDDDSYGPGQIVVTATEVGNVETRSFFGAFMPLVSKPCARLVMLSKNKTTRNPTQKLSGFRLCTVYNVLFKLGIPQFRNAISKIIEP